MTVQRKFFYRLINAVIAGIWLINGLICKLLNLVPRHEKIVAAITGSDQAALLTKLIGLGEVFIFCWVISGYRSKFCAVVQIILVLSMNIVEFCKVPELLLFGKLNLVFAVILAVIIALNNFSSYREVGTKG